MRWLLITWVAAFLAGCSSARVMETYERTPASARVSMHEKGQAVTEARANGGSVQVNPLEVKP